ncbi:MAG: gfo/Idh/MocA family oxidoreductase, partial [Actinobacteria bacterium]|nr:gfo/Idh/MocA family oxidoreductase [Actinomycetota bacterium]
MMGRHHARLLQDTPGVSFAGAVDPAGDQHGAVRDREKLFPSIAALLAAGAPDFAILALPTEEHLAGARELAAAGVHLLIEKPLAATADAGREILAACQRGGVLAAVGHVERCNPALVEMRRRIGEGQLGEIFLIATERVGPFPNRIRDVGVVKDLATHDLDLVRWIGGAPIAR